MSSDPEKLHRDALVADLHCDTALYIKGGRDIGVRNQDGHVDLPRLNEGGVNVQIFACYVPPQLPDATNYERAGHLIELLRSIFRANDERISLTVDTASLRATVESGRLAAMISIENGQAINSKLDALKQFHQNGVRSITLCHRLSHSWCGSSSDPKDSDRGLTPFGKDVIRCMNDLGMIVDVSHASERTVADVLDISQAPIMASHSCARTLCDHDRNLTDDQIRAIAEKGGIIGINFCGDFLNEQRRRLSEQYIKDNWDEIVQAFTLMDGEFDAHDFPAQMERCRPIFKRWQEHLQAAPVTVADVADHVDHIARLVGPDHVALGSDFDGIFSPPTGLSDASCFPAITEELATRGHSEQDIRKILGLNFLRILSVVGG